jgi:hypothetical protein
MSFVRVIVRFARIYATLPSGFSGSCLPNKVAKHRSKPEQRLETPFSSVCKHQRPFYLAENDAAPEAASCNSRGSRCQHMRQKRASRIVSMRFSSQLLAVIMAENGYDLRQMTKHRSFPAATRLRTCRVFLLPVLSTTFSSTV